MPRRSLLVVTLTIAVVFIASPLWADDGKDSGQTPHRTPQAWTFDDAAEQLKLNPQDVYLQYVVLQLGRNEQRGNQAADLIQRLNRRRGWGPDRRADLFDLFTGALAVQESLQLDTMRGQSVATIDQMNDPLRQVIKVADLRGPTVKSHPWGQIMAALTVAGKKPEVSALSLCVPDDQYLVEFRSLSKLMELIDVGDLWGTHLFSQAAKDATTQRAGERLKTQLAIQTDPLTRPFYDVVVDDVAITGTDLYFREGTDITMLFTLKQPEVFKMRMDGFLAAAEKSRPDATRTTGKIAGVDYVQVATPDRAICCFSAYPKANLHVRSNSKAALERVLRAVAGRQGVTRLGDSAEFKYIRALMVRGDKREDVFVYLSDPLIRRLVGPELKLTERRRMLCYNHLRMIGHAAMLYRTQYGQWPKSLEQLAESGCSPAPFATNRLDWFGKDALFCPCGGKYSLSPDGTTGVCTYHGHAQQLVPCLEIPQDRVTQTEAQEYKQFVEAYNRYWQRYFDPIAVRIQLTPKQYRAETIILPLIDNSVYTGLAAALGGEPEPLDALPVPKRNIFSIAVHLNKEALLKNRSEVHGVFYEMSRAAKESGMAQLPDAVTMERFFRDGIGNQVSMNVYDAYPMFDFNLPGFLGEMIQQFSGSRFTGGMGDEIVPISFLVASLNSPVYVAVPVKDAEIVDKFLDQLDKMLAQLARRAPEREWFPVDFDFYKVPLTAKDERIRCYAVRFGPIKWRMFYARLGDGLYVASKQFILEDLAALEGKANSGEQGPDAHAMVRVRPDHWNEVLPEFQLGWAEGSREACLNNLGPLSSVARAVSASSGGKATGEHVHKEADNLYGVHFFCPDDGKYELSADGKHVTCSVHGSAAAPRQLAAPSPRSAMGKLLKDFGGLTAELTFLVDGLHAVVTITRK